MLCLSHSDIFIHKSVYGKGSPGWEIAANLVAAEPFLARVFNKTSSLLPVEQYAQDGGIAALILRVCKRDCLS